MKVLYVSDLDGTLLRSDEKTSVYTNQVINELTEKGMLFFLCDGKILFYCNESNKRVECPDTHHYI